MEHIKSILRNIENNPTEENSIVYFPVLRDSINNSLKEIQQCDISEQAGNQFNLLEDIDFILTKLTFKEVSLPEDLKKIIIDFDRINSQKMARIFI